MTQTQHCGLVAVVGAPNAGKSTLVNALVGQKVAIVSPKAQTTRTRLLGVAIQGEAQNNVLRPGISWRHDDFGSVSSTTTVKVPARISASLLATRSKAGWGTLPSNVPSGASSQPPSFMVE